MKKTLLKTVMLEQQLAIAAADQIDRVLSFDVDSFIRSEHIVIITGIRRSGKSTLLQHFRDAQSESGYYLNFDDERLFGFSVEDFQLMMEIFTELHGEQRVCYFDEIQNIKGWERFARRLHEQGYKLFITGSNANMLSQELGTHLTGRYLQIELYPFSFREFVTFKKQDIAIDQLTTTAKAKLNNSMQSYIKLGGFPQYVRDELLDYLQVLYENILYRDIVVRYKLPSDHMIKQLAFYFASNVGKEVTYNSLKKLLQAGSSNTVSDYCQYFENSYLFFLVKRYSYSLKSQLAAPKKVYCVDTGMAHAIGFRSSADQGRMLENIVFIELRRRKYTVYYHQQKKECDFIACKQNRIEHVIQVCYEMSEPETKERELSGLLEAMQLYQLQKGIIITMSEHDSFVIEDEGASYEVTVLPIWEWLLA